MTIMTLFHKWKPSKEHLESSFKSNKPGSGLETLTKLFLCAFKPNKPFKLTIDSICLLKVNFWRSVETCR